MKKNIKTQLSEARKYRSMEGRKATLLPPAEVIEDMARRTVVYRCVAIKTHRPEVATSSQAERALRNVWADVTFIARAKQYGAIEVRFKQSKIIKQKSVIYRQYMTCTD